MKQARRLRNIFTTNKLITNSCCQASTVAMPPNMPSARGKPLYCWVVQHRQQLPAIFVGPTRRIIWNCCEHPTHIPQQSKIVRLLAHQRQFWLQRHTTCTTRNSSCCAQQTRSTPLVGTTGWPWLICWLNKAQNYCICDTIEFMPAKFNMTRITSFDVAI